ncbi:Sodium/hydrogen exchanger family-domain-containing protein [Irpex lacteus]|nr:Sodium/hydrogen exchanger family-domain-containing protein [Irpex lacteus]
MLPPSGLSYIFPLSYSQLPATELLVLLSFVILLNVVRLVADYVLHAGIIAEIVLGSIYGTPLAAILPEAWETTFTALGYLGLIGLVFEGGLSTDLPALLANLPLSISCATLGVALLIAFSVSPKGEQQQKNTPQTSNAAVIDDVIGLVLASLIPALSAIARPNARQSSALHWTIIRPIVSSVLIALVAAIIARFVLRPLFWYRQIGERCTFRGFGTRNHADGVQLTLAILSVSAFSAIAFYTGSSVLYGAYLAGMTLTYIALPSEASSDDSKQSRTEALSFERMYSRTITPLQDRLLAPLFFASIGFKFSIPFRALWRPVILWRGVVYSILMCAAKLATATFSSSSPSLLSHLAPSFFLGIAMVSRGEIGLLVVQIGHDSQSSLLSDDTYLIAVWAILLCTLVGPIGVGIVVRRWGRWLQGGVWG